MKLIKISAFLLLLQFCSVSFAQMYILTNDQGKHIFVANKPNSKSIVEQQMREKGGTNWKLHKATNEKICIAFKEVLIPGQPWQLVPSSPMPTYNEALADASAKGAALARGVKNSQVVSAYAPTCNRAKFPLEKVILDPLP